MKDMKGMKESKRTDRIFSGATDQATARWSADFYTPSLTLRPPDPPLHVLHALHG
jgi:hypothetical protein